MKHLRQANNAGVTLTPQIIMVMTHSLLFNLTISSMTLLKSQYQTWRFNKIVKEFSSSLWSFLTCSGSEVLMILILALTAQSWLCVSSVSWGGEAGKAATAILTQDSGKLWQLCQARIDTLSSSTPVVFTIVCHNLGNSLDTNIECGRKYWKTFSTFYLNSDIFIFIYSLLHALWCREC